MPILFPSAAGGKSAYAFLGDHGVDGTIVGFDGDAVENVGGVENAHQQCIGARGGERLVVEAPAPAEAQAGRAHRDGRHHDDVGFRDGIRAEPRPRGLADPEAPGAQVGQRAKFRPVQRPGFSRDRKQYTGSGVGERRRQVGAARLAEGGDVCADRRRLTEGADEFDEAPANGGVIGGAERRRHPRTTLCDRGADGLLGGDEGGICPAWRTIHAPSLSQRAAAVGKWREKSARLNGRRTANSYAGAMTSTDLPSGNAQFATAVVPAAGLGTRFLPATKTVPKELLPVVDTPGIELIAEEAAAAGAHRLAIITSERKVGVMAHFSEDPTLEGTLERRGKDVLLHKVQRAPGLIEVESVRQERPLGLGHAIGQVEQILDPEEQAVAVLLPDDLVLPMGVLERMSEVRAEFGGTVLCAFEVPGEEVSSYGVFATEDTDNPSVKRVTGMVEKPAREDAPSNLAAAGRYLLDRAIFDALRAIEPGAGGEYQVTDAIAKLIEDGHPVHVVVHDGTRHDLGNPGGYIKACVDFALQSDAYGAELRTWLGSRLDS